MQKERFWVQFPHISGGVNFFITTNELEEQSVSIGCYEIDYNSWRIGQTPI